MDEQRAAILAHLRDFLESAISKAKLNFAETGRRSTRLQGTTGAHGSPIRSVATSTLHDHLRGQRKNLPSWSWFANLWAVLVVAATENHVDPAELGTLEDWRRVYETAAAQLRELPKPPRANESSPSLLVDPRTTWWAAYSDLVPFWFERYLNLEPIANQIRCYEDVYVPGLLQTEEYAEHVIRLEHGQAPEAEIKHRVELRMLRQSLQPYGGRRLWVVIHENALRNPPVGRAVMQRQLRHLLAAPDHTTIQVLPHDAPACQGIAVPITLLRFHFHAGLSDTLYLEQCDGALYPDDLKDRELYTSQLSDLAIAALRPKSSRDYVRRLLDEI
jgi:hypothetical protein